MAEFSGNIKPGTLDQATEVGYTYLPGREAQGIGSWNRKWKSTAPINSWTAISANQKNKLAYSGWRMAGKGILGNKFMAQTVQYTGESPLKFLAEREFYATLSMMRGMPGTAATRAIYQKFKQAGLDPQVAIHGLPFTSGPGGVGRRFGAESTKRPSVVFSLAGRRGQEMISIPFEMEQGLVSSSGKLYSARTFVNASNQSIGFSDLLVQKMAGISWESEKAIPSLMRDAISDLREGGILEAETSSGYEMSSRARIRRNQFTFDPSHPLSVRLKSLRGGLLDLQKSAAHKDIMRDSIRFQHNVDTFYDEVKAAGYSLDGIKPENLFNRSSQSVSAIAMRSIPIYAGIQHAKMEKGIHQLFQRAEISQVSARKAGFARTLPWIMSPLQGNNYEVPINLGYVRGKANRIMGDSSTVIGSERLLNLLGNYPHRQTLKMSVATLVGVDSVQELSRRTSPWVRDLLDRPEVRKGLTEDLYYEFGAPEGVRGKYQRGKPLLIGVSTSRVGSGKVVSGEAVKLQQGYGIKSVRARPTSAGLEYEFVVSRPKGTVPLGRMGFLVGGTKRVSSHRAVDLGGIDLLARAEDVFSSKQATQTNLTAHWFGLAAEHDLATDELAKLLGVDKSTRFVSDPVYTAGNDWEVTTAKMRKVRRWFHDKLNISKDRQARRAFTRMFLGESKRLDDKTADILMRQVGLYNTKTGELTTEGKELKREYTSGRAIRRLRNAPFAVRAGVGAGLRSTRGFRLRMDHMYAMVERLGVDSKMDPYYRAHAEAISKLIKKKSMGLVDETANLLGPLFGTTAKGTSGPVYSVGKYAEIFTAPPNMTGGVALEELANTALDRKNGGFWIDLPGKINLYGGSMDDLAQGGRKHFYSTSRIWMPSALMMDVSTTPGGSIFQNNITREFSELDKVLRAYDGGDLAGIELQYNKLNFLTRKSMFGKDGRLVPSARVRHGTEARLQYMAPKVGTELDIQMTEKRFSEFYGKGAGKQIKRMQKGGSFYASGAVEPLQYGPHYMPGMRIRLMNEDVMINLESKLKGAVDIDEVVLVGEAAVTIGERDHDLDVFRAWAMRGIGQQRRLKKMWEQERKFFQYARDLTEQELGKMMPDDKISVNDILPIRKQASHAAQRWGQYLRTKSAVPLGELFFRNRRHMINNIVGWNMQGRSGIQQLESLGLGKLAKAKLSAEHKIAYQATSHMMKQQFLGKGRTYMRTFKAMNEILKIGSGKTNQKNVKRAVQRALEQVVMEGKFRAPMFSQDMMTALRSHGVNPSSVDDIVPWIAERVAEASAIIEPELAGRSDAFESAFRGVTPYKSVGQMARVLGVEATREGTSDPRLASDLLQALGQRDGPMKEAIERVIATDNARIKLGKTVDKLKGMGNMWGEGFGTGLANVAERGYNGVVKLWQSGGWGKAGIIGAGLILGKGLLDLSTGSDTITPTNAPMPPTSVLPLQGEDTPIFAMYGPGIDLEQVQQGGGFGMQGDAGNPMFKDIQQAIMGEMIDSPGGYGYMVNDNLPQDEFSMEAYIASKMRSDF